MRILDSKRKFVEAAQRYYELSQMQNKQVHDAAKKLTGTICWGRHVWPPCSALSWRAWAALLFGELSHG